MKLYAQDRLLVLIHTIPQSLWEEVDYDMLSNYTTFSQYTY